MQTSNSEPEAPLAYQVKPFCRRVGISPATFYKLLKLGKIKIVKIGGRTLVPASEAERLLSDFTTANIETNFSRRPRQSRVHAAATAADDAAERASADADAASPAIAQAA